MSHGGGKGLFKALVAIIYSVTIVACNPKSPDSPEPNTSSGSFFEASSPNIILIVADDLGYTDIGPFGSEIATPELARLAAEGVRLSHFYATPSCSTTRAQLMSGVDNHLAGLGTMGEIIQPHQRGHPGYEGYLNERIHSLPQVLSSAGYRTYMAGKWHLGMGDGQIPTARGFDRSFAMLGGVASHYDAFGSAHSIEKTPYREDGVAVDWPANAYSSDLYTDRLISFIAQTPAEAKPFFAYLAFTAPHFPLQAPSSNLQQYLGAYDDGYASLAKARLSGLKAAGLDSNWGQQTQTLERLESLWLALSADEKRRQSRRMEAYAAMIDRIDENIGRLLDSLRESGRLDNTIVVFTSDNGASATEAEGHRFFGERVATADNSLGNMGMPSSYISLGMHWASAINIPFSGFKHNTSEGGIRVPAILWWGPAVKTVGQRRGSVDARTMTVRDLTASIYRAAGVSIDALNASSDSKHPISGRPLVFANPDCVAEEACRSQNDVVFGWEYRNKFALLRGDWKIVKTNGAMPQKWRLFNIRQQPQETKDVSADQPQLFQELLTEWDRYLEENNVRLPP